MLPEQVQEALGHLVRLQREAISGLSGAGARRAPLAPSGQAAELPVATQSGQHTRVTA
jgi:hypothetical protein